MSYGPQSIGEEIIAFVVHDDERGEVADLDSPDRFHAELWKINNLDFGDVVLRQTGSWSPD